MFPFTYTRSCLTGFLFVSAFFCHFPLFASGHDTPDSTSNSANAFISGDSTFLFVLLPDSADIPFLVVNSTTASDSLRKERLIAGLLAFPLPFGILGLHRIYLGTKPYIPFVYVATIGGCLGILPLIDFISILTSDKEKIKRFRRNPKVFMWSK